MAKIERAQGVTDEVGIFNSDGAFELSDNSPVYETEDANVIANAKAYPDVFAVTEGYAVEQHELVPEELNY